MSAKAVDALQSLS